MLKIHPWGTPVFMMIAEGISAIDEAVYPVYFRGNCEWRRHDSAFTGQTSGDPAVD